MISFAFCFNSVEAEKKKILIIEDNTETQLIFKIHLRDLYSLEIADNAEKGIGLLKENKYDLLILDINLPGKLDGEDVLKEIRSGMNLPNFPVVVITAYALREDKDKFLNLGASEYLSKPVEKVILRKEIAKFFQESI